MNRPYCISKHRELATAFFSLLFYFIACKCDTRELQKMNGELRNAIMKMLLIFFLPSTHISFPTSSTFCEAQENDIRHTDKEKPQNARFSLVSTAYHHPVLCWDMLVGGSFFFFNSLNYFFFARRSRRVMTFLRFTRAAYVIKNLTLSIHSRSTAK